ncbi:MAG: DUF2905 domain-containing protein [Bryobacteraceae bacterium]
MNVGKMLIVLGLVLTGFGVLLTLSDKLPFKLGRLPGDIVVEGKNGGFYFPIVTCIVVSAVLSLISWIVSRR